MERSIITINLLVDNEFGVLTRITALVRREGFNIKSLAAEVTEDPRLSQLLISVECLVSALPRVLGRLNKLECVKSAELVTSGFDLGKQLKQMFVTLNEAEKEDGSHG
jgi:acetolactate synthase-1/3 small subunit